MELREYLRILYRRKGWVVGTLLAFFLIQAAYIYTEVPLYAASGQVVLRRLNPLHSYVGGPAVPTMVSYQTQVLEVTSLPVLVKAAQKLGEKTTPAQIQSILQVVQKPDTEIILIEVTHPDARTAVKVANAVAEAFEEFSLQQSRKKVQEALDFQKDKEIKPLAAKIEADEEALRQFRKTKGVFDIGEQMKAVLRRLAEAEAQELEQVPVLEQKKRRLEELRADVERLIRTLKEGASSGKGDEELVKRLTQGDGQEMSPDQMLWNLRDRLMGGSVLPSEDRARKLRADLEAARTELERMQRVWTDAHPEVVAQKAKVSQMAQALEREDREGIVERMLRRRFADYESWGKLREEIAVLEARVAAARRVAAEVREKVGALSRDELEYLALTRSLSAGRERLAVLLQRVADLELERVRTEGFVSIYQRAVEAEARPKKSVQTLPWAVILAVMASVVVAYLANLVDTTIRTDHEISRYLDAATLGVVPYMKREEERLILDQPLRSQLTEIFSTIISFYPPMRVSSGARTFLVVSFNEGEGKSTVTANLGAAFAHSGYKTLVIDSDLRQPRLHELFGVEASPGFSTCLEGTLMARQLAREIFGEAAPDEASEWLRILQTPPGWQGRGLYVIASGAVPENPAGLLRSDRCKQFLTQCRDEMDVVLIDAPPLVGAADALALVPLVDGVLFVIEAASTTREEAMYGKRLIDNAGGKLIGCILNKVREKGGAMYYYYTKDYRYGASG